MVREGYEWAGVVSIVRAVTGLVAIALVLTFDISSGSIFRPWQASQLLLFVFIDGLMTVSGVYAALKLRQLLNRQYLVHAVDGLILVLICAGVASTLVNFGFRAVVIVQPDLAPAVLAVLVVLCVVFGVVGIVFAIRLLQMETDLGGYKKPLACICMAQSVGYLLVITAALAAVAEVAYHILLALVFFRSGEEPEELEVI